MNNLTNIAQTQPFTIAEGAAAVRFDAIMLRDFNGPILLFDHAHSHSAGFPPHPHAGLCVITYLFEDSAGALRDRDSINREIIVEPGDLLWFQMASGLIHEENPAVDGVEINQMQIWVNLSERLHSLPPATFLLRSSDIPAVADGLGNRIRVVLGEYGGKRSPLTVTEPFALFDMALSSGTRLRVPEGWSAVVYAVSGTVVVDSAGKSVELAPGQVVGARPGSELLLSGQKAHALYLARPLLSQPLFVQGMYAMTSQEEVDAAKRRFHAGDFGDVVPYPKVKHPGQPYVPAGREPDLAVAPAVIHRASVRHYDQGWWQLHFQYCKWEYNNTETAFGYRFVWENPDGKEEPYQLGGYIPYMEYVTELLKRAEREGWGNIPYRDSF